jgi:hypothetical protein
MSRLNHSVLVVFLLPWAALVARERGCSAAALWRALYRPYGSGRRLVGVTFWLAFQYQLCVSTFQYQLCVSTFQYQLCVSTFRLCGPERKGLSGLGGLAGPQVQLCVVELAAAGQRGVLAGDQ